MSIKQVLGSLNLGSIRKFLTSLYHRAGPGRKPYDPVSMLKAQLLKHLFRVPSDRRLALVLKGDRKVFSRAKELLLLNHLRVRGLEGFHTRLSKLLIHAHNSLNSYQAA